MTTRLSIKISNIQFILSIMIVVLHSATYVVNLPGQGMVSIYGRNLATWIQLFFSEGLCRIAVPLFFILSGFLFYHTYNNTWLGYVKKLKRRFWSLVVPYLFWSASVFFVFYFAQRIPGVSRYFSTRDTMGFGTCEIFTNIVVTSFNSPLWFCSHVIVFVLFAPIGYWLCGKYAIVSLPIACYLWYRGYCLGIRMDGLFFWLIGAYSATHQEKLAAWFTPKRLKRLGWCMMVLWITVLAWRTTYLSGLNVKVLLEGQYNAVLEISMKFIILLGLPAFWCIWDELPRVWIADKWKVSGFSFLLFVAHHPIVGAIRKLIVQFTGTSEIAMFTAYFLVACSTISLVICLGLLAKRVCPCTYGFLVGNR